MVVDVTRGETKNKIHPLLINELIEDKNVDVLSMFRYSSDHRLVRAVTEILKRMKNKNLTKK